MYDTNLEEAPHEIRELLGNSHQWDFDIIKLESLTEKRYINKINSEEKSL